MIRNILSPAFSFSVVDLSKKFLELIKRVPQSFQPYIIALGFFLNSNDPNS
jgi:hypothetical protein